MASHWGINGEVNGYMSKFWGLFLLPIISLGIFLLLTYIPKIDPMKENVEKFRKHYDNFIVLIILFMFYVHALTLFWNMGYRFDMMRFMIPSLSALFYYIGVMIENSKRNWFIGIRTPWTLSSDSVWDKTHALGGKLFKVVGLISLLGIIVPKYSFYILFFPIIIVSLYTVIYSYLEYKKETNNK